jgi:ribosomal protein S18 acetylase RimI-like enzyme
MVRVREAVADDALAVAQVHVRSWQAGYRGLISQNYLDALCPEDRASRYTFDRMTLTGPFTLVAVDDDAICGLVTTGKSRDTDLQEAGEIWAIYVDPARWGTGVGRSLMAAATNKLRCTGYGEASLWVLAGNTRARRFYELVGWQLDEADRTDVIGNTPVYEVRYRRQFGSTPHQSHHCVPK